MYDILASGDFIRVIGERKQRDGGRFSFCVSVCVILVGFFSHIDFTNRSVDVTSNILLDFVLFMHRPFLSKRISRCKLDFIMVVRCKTSCS